MNKIIIKNNNDIEIKDEEKNFSFKRKKNPRIKCIYKNKSDICKKKCILV